VTVFVCIASTADKGIKYTAAAVLFGDTVAETASFLLNYILYRADVKGVGKSAKEPGIIKKILNIALPVSGSSYLSSVLHTAENLLVPLKLTVFHGVRERGLELFGAVRSMALPVLFFPASFLTSLSTMLIPEVSSANAKGDRQEVKKTVKTAVGITVVLSIFVASVFLFNSDRLSLLLYDDTDVGFAMKILAPIVPFMYLESVTAGILKGLDQQVNMFKYNLCDSILRIAAVFVLLPMMGIKGYLLIMTVSNCFTSSLSYHRLCKVTDLKTDLLGWIIKPVCFALVGAAAARPVYLLIKNELIGFILATVVHAAVFFTLLAILSPSLIKPIVNKLKK
jgi:stage V sporulation protein B